MVWTEITRAQYRRDGLRYASDMTDSEWALIEPHLPAPRRLGRPLTTDLRAVVEALLYMAASGCQWRLLPKCFPPCSTVQGYFYCWRDDRTWSTINHLLVMRAREMAGREASPSAGVIDSQSVKTTESVNAGCAVDKSARIADRSKLSRTVSRTKCAGCSAGTKSWSDGGNSQAWSTSQQRKVLLMPPNESHTKASVEPIPISRTGS